MLSINAGLSAAQSRQTLATFPGGNRMVLARGRSYLHTDSEIIAFDRAGYVEAAVAARRHGERRKELTARLRKVDRAATKCA